MEISFIFSLILPVRAKHAGEQEKYSGTLGYADALVDWTLAK